jgi:uncharacterized membrane protein YqaE (UPF0057 family)
MKTHDWLDTIFAFFVGVCLVFLGVGFWRFCS